MYQGVVESLHSIQFGIPLVFRGHQPKSPGENYNSTRLSVFLSHWFDYNLLRHIPQPTLQAADCLSKRGTLWQIVAQIIMLPCWLEQVSMVSPEAYQGMMQQNANRLEHIMRSCITGNNLTAHRDTGGFSDPTFKLLNEVSQVSGSATL